MISDYIFTIIIPHYNIPNLLERCLNSIPNREDVQVIVIDDCSDKETITILKDNLENKFHNVQFIYQEQNGGGGKCRNVGLSLATGKWLLFADADDFFTDGLSEIFDRYKFDDSNIDIVYFKVDCVLSDDITKTSNDRDFNKWRIDEYLSSKEERALRFLHCEPWGKMISNDLVKSFDIKFSETKVCNDYYFSAITGFHAKEIKADERCLYYVTVRPGSVSYKTDSTEKMKIRIQVAASVEAYLKNYGYVLDDKFKPEKIEYRMIPLMKQDFKLGLNLLNEIKKMGLPILPIIGRMIKIFFNNRLKKTTN